MISLGTSSTICCKTTANGQTKIIFAEIIFESKYIVASINEYHVKCKIAD